MRLVDYRAGYFIRCVRPLADRTTVVTAGESPQITLLDIGAVRVCCAVLCLLLRFCVCLYSAVVPAMYVNVLTVCCCCG